MSGEARISEREAVMRERAASAKARCAALFAARTEGGARNISSGHIGYLVPGCACRDCEEMAARRFPLPQVERPRVMKDGQHEWRVVRGEIEWRLVAGCGYKGSEWAALERGAIKEWSICYPTTARIKLWADLLASPNELVDDDEPDPGVSS